MSRPGKGRMVPSSEEDDAATQITGEESRRLNGVNRQLQPDAAAQRLAASQSAAIKRKADAMPEDERKRKDAERNRLNRKKKAAEKAAAAATARESAAAEAAAADATAASSTATMPTLQTFNGWSAKHCGETIDGARGRARSVTHGSALGRPTPSPIGQGLPALHRHSRVKYPRVSFAERCVPQPQRSDSRQEVERSSAVCAVCGVAKNHSRVAAGFS